MKYTIVLTYTFATEWLQKSWKERGAFEREHLQPIFAKYANTVQPRFYDAEAFSTRCSDFVILETEDLKQYYFLIEELRESRLFSEGLIEFKDITIGVEDGFREFEKEVLEAR
ncbi:darcynin family protein [Vitiosangium sp. GDMCC 1.1324]|uniref:darcynin family protein n=1 Tax=Vitiosangium sp. (strain GDMCC 1.1324) TaxID=2138576 RepID=UPI000D35FC4C|nr:darcynin family protein [Vitiosangium sp. GDMCC 1.1324]PTL76225.1 hypothetical protein DAT35_50160 [Vitiosangium sp. GDMCC 1.1324]